MSLTETLEHDVTDPGTLRPKRRYTRIRPALHAQIYRLKGRGLTHEEIANRLRIAECSVSRALRKPLPPAQFSDLSRRCGLNRVDKQECRERVKDLLMARCLEFIDEAFELLDKVLADHDARGFADVMHAIERLDRVIARAAGEGRRVVHHSVPQTPTTAYFKTLVEELLSKYPDARVVSASG
jgi:hypothetical protein